MKNRTINEKYKGNAYGKNDKWSVVWVRAITEKENNVTCIIPLKLFIFPCRFAFHTLAKHYLICLVWVFFFPCVQTHISHHCLFYNRQQPSSLARAPSERQCHAQLTVSSSALFVFAKCILNVFCSPTSSCRSTGRWNIEKCLFHSQS